MRTWLEWRKEERLTRAVSAVRACPAGQPVPRRVLRKLLRAWGNPGYAAGLRYLEQIARLMRETEGVVLECGSGVTTLLAGLLAEKYGRHVWTLEHHPDWCGTIRRQLARRGIRTVKVCHAPLTGYGDYEWYRIPEIPLPADFGLVICDGPPGRTQGGRYGMLPQMQARLRPDCRILMDDTHRRKERAVMDRWAALRPVRRQPVGRFGFYTELALG